MENNKNIEISKNESTQNKNKTEEEKSIINLIPISETEEKTSPKKNTKEENPTTLFSIDAKKEKENENIFSKKLFENNPNPFSFSNNKTEKSENADKNQSKTSFNIFNNSNNNNEKSKSLFTFTFLANNNNKENNNNKFTPFLNPLPNNNNNNLNENISNNNGGNIFSNLINNTNDKKNNDEKEIFDDEDNNDEDDEDDEADKPKTKYVSDPLKSQDYSDYIKIYNKHINNFYLYNSKEKKFISKGNGFFSIEKTKDENKKQVVIVFRNQTGIKIVEGFLDKKFEKIEINSKNFDFLLSFEFLMVNEKKEPEFGFAKIPFTDENQANSLKKSFEEAFSFIQKK